jgi:hypothetical protein
MLTFELRPPGFLWCPRPFNRSMLFCQPERMFRGNRCDVFRRSSAPLLDRLSGLLSTSSSCAPSLEHTSLRAVSALEL